MLSLLLSLAIVQKQFNGLFEESLVKIHNSSTAGCKELLRKEYIFNKLEVTF